VNVALNAVSVFFAQRATYGLDRHKSTSSGFEIEQVNMKNRKEYSNAIIADIQSLRSTRSESLGYAEKE
jgi:hypothetical protein